MFYFYAYNIMSRIAVVRTGGKQYLVHPGDKLKVEKLISASDKMDINDVLLTAEDDGSQVEVGTPKTKATVAVEVLKQGRGKKIIVVHYKPKVRYHKKYGHRQPFTEVKVAGVS